MISAMVVNGSSKKSVSSGGTSSAVNKPDNEEVSILNVSFGVCEKYMSSYGWLSLFSNLLKMSKKSPIFIHFDVHRNYDTSKTLYSFFSLSW